MGRALSPWIAWVLHALLMAPAALAIDGLLRLVQAWCLGRPAPPFFQPWRDLVRLWRKPGVVPARASFVFSAAPAVSLATTAAAALLVPSFTLGMASAGAADLIVIAGLMMASRAAIALAAHDAAAPPVILAAARRLTSRLGAEPVLLLTALAAVLSTGGGNLDAMATALRDGAPGLRFGGGVLGLALLGLAALEPVPAPPIFSGRPLALVVTASHIRMMTALSLAAAIGLPIGLAQAGSGAVPALLGLACWALKLALLAALAAAAGPHRLVAPAATMLAIIAILVLAVQGVV